MRKKPLIKGWCNIDKVKELFDKDPTNEELINRYEYLKHYNKIKPSKDAMQGRLPGSFGYRA